MDYHKHYQNLIFRSENRISETLTEKHHIIPRCMGGSDSDDNIVELTPREHYIAHLLLVKMYPENASLVYAANMMTVGAFRSNRKYSWLRKRFINEYKKRVGQKNGSYGRKWYYCPRTYESGKFSNVEVPSGWLPGRVMKKENVKVCGKCGIKLRNKESKFCRNHIERNGTRDKANVLWEKFQNSEYDSLRSFSKSDMCDISQPALTKLFKKYIDEYGPVA